LDAKEYGVHKVFVTRCTRITELKCLIRTSSDVLCDCQRLSYDTKNGRKVLTSGILDDHEIRTDATIVMDIGYGLSVSMLVHVFVVLMVKQIFAEAIVSE
jgi:uncharacterized protein (UPF0335 family)